MHIKKISILTPSFNSGLYIERAILSVLNQDYDNWEHIIVDGGSTDGTIDILRNYPHIKWISEADKGQSDAMNKALRMARGEIVSFLNADDFYEPDVFGFIAEEFSSLPGNSLLAGNCNFLNQRGEIEVVDRPSKLTLRSIIVTHIFPGNPASYFYHKSIHDEIGFYDVDDHYVMDLDFILRAVQVANVKYVDRTLGNFHSLEGTKTYEDRKAGTSYQRKQALFKKYERYLPLTDRIYLRYFELKKAIHKKIIRTTGIN